MRCPFSRWINTRVHTGIVGTQAREVLDFARSHLNLLTTFLHKIFCCSSTVLGLSLQDFRYLGRKSRGLAAHNGRCVQSLQCPGVFFYSKCCSATLAYDFLQKADVFQKWLPKDFLKVLFWDGNRWRISHCFRQADRRLPSSHGHCVFIADAAAQAFGACNTAQFWMLQTFKGTLKNGLQLTIGSKLVCVCERV